MARKTLVHDGHQIEVQPPSFWGEPKVFYDGRQVSSRWCLFACRHLFCAEEKDGLAQYEVEVVQDLFRDEVTVRRNGLIIYAER